MVWEAEKGLWNVRKRTFVKKTCGMIIVLSLMLISLTGCGAIGDKSASLRILYDVTAAASFFLLIGFCCMVRKKDAWFLLLFSSVFVVNAGYLMLSGSSTLERALQANRLAYLGSVCLPMAMFMIISGVCKIKYRNWILGILVGVGIFVFLIAASPGYADIYYREATLIFINGAAVIDKVYGSWHCIYLFYLVAYFAAMAGVIGYALVMRRIDSAVQAVCLAAAVLVNMGVWLLEQLVRIDFEMLSFSYIITEVFLLSLCIPSQLDRTTTSVEEDAVACDACKKEAQCADHGIFVDQTSHAENNADTQPMDVHHDHFAAQIRRLTPTERIIFNLYMEGKSTKEIMAELNIKENTLKYHNKNIYGKLGVNSRKQLVAMATGLNIK